MPFDIWDVGLTEFNPGDAMDTGFVGAGAVPLRFQEAVKEALRKKHIDYTRLPAGQFDAFVQKAWDNSYLSDTFQQIQDDPNYTDKTVISAIATEIDGVAFTPSELAGDLATLGINMLQESGIKLTAAQQAIVAMPQAIVPQLYQGQYPITESHAEGDPGLDVGTPVGTQIYAPFAGTVHLEDGGTTNWGYRTIVTMADGSWYAIGHLSDFAGLKEGQVVQPGQLIGLGGGEVGDPHSGHSTGPHIEFMAGSKGSSPYDTTTFMDPTALYNGIMSGGSFTELAKYFGADAAGLVGTGVLSTAQRDLQMGIDPFLSAQYANANSVFRNYTGKVATAKDILSIVACAGGDTIERVQDCVRAMPSHISGLNLGQYGDQRKLVDSASQSLLGHPATDGIVKELYDQGIRTQNAVKNWYDFRSPNQIGMTEKQYNGFYTANQAHMTGKLNESGFDPRIAIQQYQEQPPPSPPDNPDDPHFVP